MTAFLTSAMFVGKALWIYLPKQNMLNNIKRNKSSSAVTADEALLTCLPLTVIAAVAPTVKQSGFNAIRAENASAGRIRFEITTPSILKKSRSVVKFVGSNIPIEQLLQDTKESTNQIIMMTRSSVGAVSVTSVANFSVMQLL